MNRKNLEFNIAWCETNLRWIAGEPPSEERDRKLAFNVAEITRLELKNVEEPLQGQMLRDPN